MTQFRIRYVPKEERLAMGVDNFYLVIASAEYGGSFAAVLEYRELDDHGQPNPWQTVPVEIPK